MRTIVCHPDNLELLKKSTKSDIVRSLNGLSGLRDFYSYKVETNANVEKDKPTGEVRLPNGNIIDKSIFKWTPNMFITYGPSDLPWLIYAGVIEEVRQPVFYLMESFGLFTDYRLLTMSIVPSPRPTILFGSA